MLPDASVIDETIPEMNDLHLSHSNALMFNLTSSDFQNITIATSYDIIQTLRS